MERFVRMIFLAGQAVSLRAGSWEAVPMNCGWLEGVCQGREPGTWGGRGILTWALGAWHRSAEGHQAVSRAHTGASVTITRAGEGMGEGGPLAREQRPNGGPKGRARQRRKSFTGIEGRDEGAPFPQKSTSPKPRATNAKSRERFHARGFCGPDTRQRLLPLLSFEPDGVGSAAAVRLEGKLAVKGGCCQAPIPSRRPALLRMRSMASSFRPLMVRRRSSSWAGS